MEKQNKNKLSEHVHFQNLNGLRFCGALLVFIFHCFTLNREIWGSFQENQTFKLIYKLAAKGHHGVGLFFTLSGFLITYLLLEEIKRKGTINVQYFFIRRILRIWPLYFIIILFGFFIFPILPFGQNTQHSLLYFSTFFSNIDELLVGMSDNINFLTITWSVSIEEQFYLSWMLLMILLPFFRKGKFFPIYFLSLILISIFFRFMHQSDHRTLYFHTFSVISDLSIGGLLAYAVQKYSLQSIVKDLKKIQIVLIYILGLVLVLTSNLLFVGPLISIERICIGLFFAFIIIEQVYSKNSFYKIDRIPYFYSSGELTYGFYMFHCIYIYYWSIFFKIHNFTNSIWYFIIYILIVFISTYTTAFLSMKYFEKPLLRLKTYFR